MTNDAAYPCCYRAARPSGGADETTVSRCGNPSVVADFCVVDHSLRKRGEELDGTRQVGDETRGYLIGNCIICRRRSLVPAMRLWEPGEIRFVRYVNLIRDTMRLIPQLPPGIIGVAGIPRSGLLPAAALATALNVPLYSLHKEEGLRSVGAGSREKVLRPGDGKLLVVDDSVFVGTAIKWARRQLAGFPAVFATVYTRRPDVTDMHAVLLPSPHLFEWNIFNNPVLAGASADKRLRGGFAFDFDGVICENPTMPYNPKTWMPVANPTPWTPRGVTIPLVITFRLERYRKLTERWCGRQGVTVERWVYHQAKTEAERDAALNVAEHKGAALRDSRCSAMFESEPQQAAIIAQVAGKPVIVPRSGEVFLP